MIENPHFTICLYKKIIFLLLCFFSFAALKAQDPVMLLTFQELGAVPNEVKRQAFKGHVSEKLKEIHGRAVSIRGFMYKAADGRLVLAAEPNLKSCCVGSAAQLERQIELEGLVGQVADSGSVVTLHGKFSVAPFKDSGGVWQRLYLLENARLIEEQRVSMQFFLISIIALIVVAGALLYFLHHIKKIKEL